MPNVVAQVSLTQQQSQISTTALYTPLTTGVYRVSTLLDASQTATGGAGLELTVKGINSFILDAPGGTTGQQVNIIRGVAGVPINYTVLPGPYGALATPFDLYVALELMA